MFITKKFLDRRTVLRGAGVSVALPLLDAMVPAATPDAVVQTLQKGFADALAQPQVKQRLLDLDMFQEGLTGAAASKRLADLSARYERVIRATGMHVE